MSISTRQIQQSLLKEVLNTHLILDVINVISEYIGLNLDNFSLIEENYEAVLEDLPYKMYITEFVMGRYTPSIFRQFMKNYAYVVTCFKEKKPIKKIKDIFRCNPSGISDQEAVCHADPYEAIQPFIEGQVLGEEAFSNVWTTFTNDHLLYELEPIIKKNKRTILDPDILPWLASYRFSLIDLQLLVATHPYMIDDSDRSTLSTYIGQSLLLSANYTSISLSPLDINKLRPSFRKAGIELSDTLATYARFKDALNCFFAQKNIGTHPVVIVSAELLPKGKYPRLPAGQGLCQTYIIYMKPGTAHSLLASLILTHKNDITASMLMKLYVLLQGSSEKNCDEEMNGLYNWRDDYRHINMLKELAETYIPLLVEVVKKEHAMEFLQRLKDRIIWLKPRSFEKEKMDRLLEKTKLLEQEITLTLDKTEEREVVSSPSITLSPM